ncbi:MAG: hypothetical protein AVDCRST_MAG11-3952, partial [uncultured Gemmatimonadaceae bacterium]
VFRGASVGRRRGGPRVRARHGPPAPRGAPSGRRRAAGRPRRVRRGGRRRAPRGRRPAPRLRARRPGRAPAVRRRRGRRRLLPQPARVPRGPRRTRGRGRAGAPARRSGRRRALGLGLATVRRVGQGARAPPGACVRRLAAGVDGALGRVDGPTPLGRLQRRRAVLRRRPRPGARQHDVRRSVVRARQRAGVPRARPARPGGPRGRRGVHAGAVRAGRTRAVRLQHHRLRVRRPARRPQPV